MTSRRLDSVEFAIRGEPMIHNPSDGRSSDTSAAVNTCNSDVEQRAPNIEVLQIEHSDQTDCLAASFDPERNDVVAGKADLCRLLA